MLSEVCAYLKNWFSVGEYECACTITDGSLDIPFLLDGQYFRIQGSIFNDGVHQYPATDLTDETFKGRITAMAVPKDLLLIVTEMTESVSKGGGNAMFDSESFGGYTYQRAKDANGKAVSIFGAYASRLARWRKI